MDRTIVYRKNMFWGTVGQIKVFSREVKIFPNSITWSNVRRTVKYGMPVKYSDRPCLTVPFMDVVLVKYIHLSFSNYLGGKQSLPHICLLETTCNPWVIATVSDGASANRKFYKLHTNLSCDDSKEFTYCVMNMCMHHIGICTLFQMLHTLLKLTWTVHTILVMENSPGIYEMKTNFYCGHTSVH